ncbi:MAG TPA: hypothetical protein VKQ27_16135 [Acetobacteraceae bacterium]|nr:hypothetical protein [Acetobacteraceae bacterium]
MTDSLPDDARLRATEAQMRRALGLGSEGPTQPAPMAPPPTPAMGLHPQRRRFVRDGEVVVQHKEHSAAGETGTNQLAAARQALREQFAAREEAERALAEVQSANRDLQTKLAHERLARDETVNRAEAARQAAEQALQAVREELESERARRLQAEERSAVTQERLHESPRQADLLEPAPAPRRRGRPPKVRQTEPLTEPAEGQDQADFVEWWVPGWQDRFR